jgi:hypothetical protein
MGNLDVVKACVWVRTLQAFCSYAVVNNRLRSREQSGDPTDVPEFGPPDGLVLGTDNGCKDTCYEITKISITRYSRARFR